MTKDVKYGKIELLVKTNSQSVLKQEFFDSYMVISGDNLIIINENIGLKTKEDEKFNVMTTGQIFNLNTIKSFRTYLNNPK